MAYVDLNPIRAGMASSPEASDHSSIKARLVGLRADMIDTTLEPLAGPASNALPLSLGKYLELADWTGGIVCPDERGALDAAAPPILRKLDLRETAWSRQVKGIESRYWQAVGTVESLMEKANALGQCWMKGGGTRRRLQNATA